MHGSNGNMMFIKRGGNEGKGSSVGHRGSRVHSRLLCQNRSLNIQQANLAQQIRVTRNLSSGARSHSPKTTLTSNRHQRQAATKRYYLNCLATSPLNFTNTEDSRGGFNTLYQPTTTIKSARGKFSSLFLTAFA